LRSWLALCTAKLTASNTSGVLSTQTVNFDVTNTGDIQLATPVNLSGDWGTAHLDRLDGNVDPRLGFAGGVTNNSSADLLFSLAISTPILLKGPVQAEGQLNYGLTSLSDSAATLTPFNDFVLTAKDKTLDNRFISKGVDIGDLCTAPANKTVNCGNLDKFGAPFGAGETFKDMDATIVFSLTANSNASFNGQVIQNAVPEPTTWGLMLAGLLLVGFVSRRRVM